MESIKKLHGLTSRKCNTRSRALGSLPAKGALNSDQVISCVMTKRRLTSGRAPGPGLKQQAPSYKASSRKRQAASPKQQASSSKPQATSSLILDPS